MKISSVVAWTICVFVAVMIYPNLSVSFVSSAQEQGGWRQSTWQRGLYQRVKGLIGVSMLNGTSWAGDYPCVEDTREIWNAPVSILTWVVCDIILLSLLGSMAYNLKWTYYCVAEIAEALVGPLKFCCSAILLLLLLENLLHWMLIYNGIPDIGGLVAYILSVMSVITTTVLSTIATGTGISGFLARCGAAIVVGLLIGVGKRTLLRLKGRGKVTLVDNNLVVEVRGVAPRERELSAAVAEDPIRGVTVKASMDIESVKVNTVKLNEEMAFISSAKNYMPKGIYPKGVGRLVAKVEDPDSKKTKYCHGGLAFLLDIGEGKTVLVFSAHQRTNIGAWPLALQGAFGQYPIGKLRVVAYARKPLDFIMLEATPDLRSVTGMKALKLVSNLENFMATCYGYDEETDQFWESLGRANRYEIGGKKQMHYVHWCTTENGSSGSPLIYKGFGVVGVHIGGDTTPKDEPVHNLATTLGFLRQKRKLQNDLRKEELYADHRDNYLDYDEVHRLLRLNPDLDPNGYWDDDMYIPYQEKDTYYDDIDLEDLYDLDRNEVRDRYDFGPEFKIVDRLRKQELDWRALFGRTPTPKLVEVQPLKLDVPITQTLHDFVVQYERMRREETKPLFDRAPDGTGGKEVENSKGKTKAETPQVSEKLKAAIEVKLKELEEKYSLDVSLERSTPFTKDLNRQLAVRLTQLNSYTKQLRVSIAGSKKKVLDLNGSGEVKPSKAVGREKSKKNQKFSKQSASGPSKEGSQKQLLDLVSQLVERLPNLPASDSKSGDSKPVAKPLPQPLEQ